jgi:hypothetical protein
MLCFIVALHQQCWATDKTTIETDSTHIAIIKEFAYGTEDSLLYNNSLERISVTTQDVQGKSIYNLPYSVTRSQPNWKRLWTNTAVLSGAFIGTLFVLECLPEDATSWNRREIQQVPLFKRWFRNVFKRGPEWDHDKFYFNYILHPYAGAAYFMGARSCGFNMWQSLLYCTCVSTIEWEFGIEAFMERPSIQDLFVTPLVGSAMGEGFYNIKRYIANNDYHLLGSKVFGNIVAFLVDPINEFIGYFAGNDARHIHDNNAKFEMSMSPCITSSYKGFSLCATF